MKTLGYFVTVIDEREAFADAARALGADRSVQVSDFREGAASLSYPSLTHVVVMTSGLPTDTAAMIGILKEVEGTFPYVGLMGSPAKLQRIRRSLLGAGISPALFASVRAPIGLPMTSESPEEIAVSIAAEILQERDELFPVLRRRDPDAS